MIKLVEEFKGSGVTGFRSWDRIVEDLNLSPDETVTEVRVDGRGATFKIEDVADA